MEAEGAIYEDRFDEEIATHMEADECVIRRIRCGKRSVDGARHRAAVGAVEINPDHYEFRDAEPFPSQEMSRKPVLPDMTPVLSSSIRWTSLRTGDRFSPMERVGRLGSPEEITSPGASSTSVPPLLRHAFWQGIL